MDNWTERLAGDQTAANGQPQRPAIDQTYTLNEAAKLTGLSVDALRQRAKRGKLGTVKGNDGLVRVRLTTADLDAIRLAVTADTDQPESSQELDESQTIKALRGETASLREALSRERDRADQAEVRAGRIEQERDEARREREDARVRAASAEGEAKALREALDFARRPAWRRWLGLAS
jgi:hypothetical protein